MEQKEILQLVCIDIVPNEIVYIIISYLKITDQFHFSFMNKKYYKLWRPDRYLWYKHQNNGILVDDRIEYTIRTNNLINKFLPHNMNIPFLPYTENIPLMNFSNEKNFIDIKELFKRLDIKIKYLYGDTYDYVLSVNGKIINENGLTENTKYFIKIFPFPKNNKYGTPSDPQNPINAHIKITNLMMKFVIDKKTPHILLPIMIFNTDIKIFIKKFKNKECTDKIYPNFVEKYHNNEYHDEILFCLYEANNSSIMFQDILTNNKTSFDNWDVLLFQLLFTLTLIQRHYPTFRHNELKPASIILLFHEKKCGKFKYYIVDHNFYIDDVGFTIALWDFDFSSIDGIVENNLVNSDWTKKIGICKNKNQYTDICYFFNLLLKYKIPEEVIQFIHRAVPEIYRNGSDLVTNGGRLLVDDEYTTPYKLLMEDDFFGKFRS